MTLPNTTLSSLVSQNISNELNLHEKNIVSTEQKNREIGCRLKYINDTIFHKTYDRTKCKLL